MKFYCVLIAVAIATSTTQGGIITSGRQPQNFLVPETALESDSVIKIAALIYQVLDTNNSTIVPKCSGVIISRKHVLTLKSCVVKVNRAKSDGTVDENDIEDLSLAVQVGFSTNSYNKIYTIRDVRKSIGETLKVSTTNKSMLSITSGIAILTSEKVYFGYHTAEIFTNIPFHTNLVEGNKVVVIGFGGHKRLWSEKASEEPGLATLVDVLDGDHCENELNTEFVREMTMCLRKSSIDMACTLDMGGPVFTGEDVGTAWLVGLQHGSKRCFEGGTSVALYLSPYKKFVDDVVRGSL